MLMEISLDGVIALTSEGVVLYWSKGAENIYGYTSQETLGKKLGDLVTLVGFGDETDQLIDETMEQGLAVVKQHIARKMVRRFTSILPPRPCVTVSARSN